jgi:exodeoxyribonuclease V beta subunit
MKRFDVLDKTTNIFGRKIIEASAGTGKTFTIEHLVVRLLQESDLTIDQILVVTFTRAATRELRNRIRSNLEKSHPQALLAFDQAQIFTIHGFCQRVLSEYAFEAGVGVDLEEWDPDEEIDLFLRKAFDSPAYSTAQITTLLKRYPLDKLKEALVKERESRAPILDFQACFQEFNRRLSQARNGERFEEAVKNYKRMTDPDFADQARELQEFLERGRVTEEEFNRLLRKKPYFLSNFRKENLKVKGVSSVYFENLHESLSPILDQASAPKYLLKRLAADWNRASEQRMAEEEKVTFDELLLKVEKCLDNPDFVARVRKRYRAAIIDEFQDTDPIQWKIFKTLFGSEETKVFYIVGDPKQSIYAFRSADIYTFLDAVTYFGEENRAYLDTNFRSEKGVVEAMNRLFADKNWINLPKLQTYLPVPACRAAKEGEGHFQFVIGEKEDDFFPFIVHEIERLHLDPKEVAVLVKDRYQGMRLFEYFQQWDLPCSLLRGDPKLSDKALEAWEELLEAIQYPENLSRLKKASFGPLLRKELKDMLELQETFRQLHPIFVEKGFAVLYAHLVRQGVIFLDEELQHVAESLAEDREKKRVYASPKGVQILTIHASKGLEFENVFCWGLAMRTTADDDVIEQDAEKMRQLYVAMTRAKKRLYVPIIQDGKEGGPGEASPIELFLARVQPNLSEFPCIDLKEIVYDLQPFAPEKKQPAAPIFYPPEREPEFLLSFSGMAQKHFEPKEIPKDILPAGAETGVIIHKIFENLFSGKGNSVDLKGTVLEGWENEVKEIVEKTLALPIFQGIDHDKIATEMEFLFPSQGGIMKGFIDLCFEKEGKYYFVDWKTNWLEEYSQDGVEKAMQEGDYFLQAEIYAEALRRLFKGSSEFGGGYFIFVRGPAVYYWRDDD